MALVAKIEVSMPRKNRCSKKAGRRQLSPFSSGSGLAVNC